MKYSIGIDTGGTFTDCVVMDQARRIAMGKAPTTPQDFSVGLLDSVRVTAESLGMTLEELLRQTDVFSLATTVSINAILTRTGARTGLITTAGFEDTILIMRIMGKYAGLGEEDIKRQVKREKPPPLVPKSLIKGMIERVDHKGEVVVALNQESVVEAVDYLASQGVEAIAVALLWSQANPRHEEAIKAIIQSRHPGIYVTISSELAPVLGEYERTATTAMNAYVGPLVHRFLKGLERDLMGNGLPRPPLVAQAHGGCLSVETAVSQPVGTISSGPVAGLVASKYLADLLGYRNVITTDMGGTSFDVGLIYGSSIEPAAETVVAQYHLAMPMMAVESIGAGSGSIAWVEPATKILKVGPRSAAARPGPACYETGGEEPTVTDADLVLGYLNPDYFLAGRRKLSRELAYHAIKTKVAGPMGMDVTEAALAIDTIVNAHMSDLLRSVTVGRGYDPRQCVLFAYGGAGPLHAWAYARDIETIVVPATASVHSAMGTLASDIVHVYQLGAPMPVPADPGRFNQIFEQLETKARQDLAKDGFSTEAVSLDRFIEMRYMRQVHEVRTPCPAGTLDAGALEDVYALFETLYERLYGKGSAYKEAGMQMVTFRVEARGSIPRPALIRREPGPPDADRALKARRAAFFGGNQVEVNVYDFTRLEAGNVVPGPAIIETPITTILIGLDQVGAMDGYLNMIIQRRA